MPSLAPLDTEALSRRGPGPSESAAAALTAVEASAGEGGISRNARTLGHALLAPTRHD